MRSMSSVILILVIVAVNFLIKAANAGKRQKETKERLDADGTQRSVSAQKREAAVRPEQWRTAKAQQDDARQVHSINMDSCESKLESLKTLYDAGVLDREEYAQRVARVKAKHAHGAGKA